MEAQTNSMSYSNDMLSYEGFRATVLADYKTAALSREVSLLGRREVLTGKAKFGIFGDGKELAQIAMAKFFNLAILEAVIIEIKHLCLLADWLQLNNFLPNYMLIPLKDMILLVVADKW
jgi:hypothetical protein